MNSVFLIIAAACTALLIECLAVRFINRLLKPKVKKSITLIPISRGCKNIEQSLRWELFRHETDSFVRDNVLLIVDCGLETEDAEIAKRLCRGRRSCRLCKLTELKSIVGDDAVCKGIELVLY